MIIGLVSLETSSLKTGCRIEVKNFFFHAAKVRENFGFRKWDLGFFVIKINFLPSLREAKRGSTSAAKSG